MLSATQKEIEQVTEYMRSQAPDLTVEFVQKVYSENVLHVRHDVWDVHTNVDRWWVITEPMNLYAQEQFPNMDLALTFHMGLCLRIPRSERQKLSEIPAEPFAPCLGVLQEASEAVARAQEVGLTTSRLECDVARRFWLSSTRVSVAGEAGTSMGVGPAALVTSSFSTTGSGMRILFPIRIARSLPCSMSGIISVTSTLSCCAVSSGVR
jgi:hypothetical protein